MSEQNALTTPLGDLPPDEEPKQESPPGPLDPLEIRSELGSGGFGQVWEAWDPELRREIALKCVRSELREKKGLHRALAREARTIATLDHPNVVPVHALGERGDLGPCFTMKRVRGRTLATITRELPRGPLARQHLADIVDIFIKVCDALAYAHERGLLHGDIKPANVMVGDFGQVYLMDWGSALVMEDGQVRLAPGRLVGTPAFLSPEQAHSRPLDVRTDVFGIGACLYAVLSRRWLFPGKTAKDCVEAARRGERLTLAEAAPHVPRRLVAIVEKALAARPEDRYPDIPALKADLTDFVRGVFELPKLHVPAGGLIVREGEPGNAAFLIEEGRCEISQLREGVVQVIRVIEAGEIFGETAALTGAPRTASVRALTDCSLRQIDKETLEEELDQARPWLGVLVRNLASRFQDRETRDL